MRRQKKTFRTKAMCIRHLLQASRAAQKLKGNSGIFKPRPYFWHERRSSTHREQFGESRRPSEDI